MNVVQGNKAALRKIVPSTGLWVDRVRKWMALSNHDTRDEVKQKEARCALLRDFTTNEELSNTAPWKSANDRDELGVSSTNLICA